MRSNTIFRCEIYRVWTVGVGYNLKDESCGLCDRMQRIDVCNVQSVNVSIYCLIIFSMNYMLLTQCKDS